MKIYGKERVKLSFGYDDEKYEFVCKNEEAVKEKILANLGDMSPRFQDEVMENIDDLSYLFSEWSQGEFDEEPAELLRRAGVRFLVICSMEQDGCWHRCWTNDVDIEADESFDHVGYGTDWFEERYPDYDPEKDEETDFEKLDQIGKLYADRESYEVFAYNSLSLRCS